MNRLRSWLKEAGYWLLRLMMLCVASLVIGIFLAAVLPLDPIVTRFIFVAAILGALWLDNKLFWRPKGGG